MMGSTMYVHVCVGVFVFIGSKSQEDYSIHTNPPTPTYPSI